jgi:hypothetical protein
VTNEVLHGLKEERNIVRTIRKGRNTNWIGQILRRNFFLKQVIKGEIEGKIEVRIRRGRRRKQILDDLTEKGRYCQLKQKVGLCGEIALEEAMDLF